MPKLGAIFQIGSLGDSIISVPVLRSLRELLPDCTEYVLVSRFDTHLNVMPSNVFEMAWAPKYRVDYQGSGNRFVRGLSVLSAVSKIRYLRPRYCVYLMPSDRKESQVQRDRAFFKAAGVKELIGFDTLPEDALAAKPELNSHGTEAFLRFRRVWGDLAEQKFSTYGSAPHLEPGVEAKRNVKKWLARRDFGGNRKRMVAVCPFSNWTSKSWSHETATGVIRQLNQSANVEVVLLGGNKDKLAAEEVVQSAGVGVNACGDFLPSESAAFLQHCSLVVCADSGPMHLAGALGIPTVSTFSRISESLSRWFPLGQNHTILYREVKCAGCKNAICSVPGHPCMRNISTEDIVTAALERLNGLPIFSESKATGTQSLVWQLSM